MCGVLIKLMKESLTFKKATLIKNSLEKGSSRLVIIHIGQLIQRPFLSYNAIMHIMQ